MALSTTVALCQSTAHSGSPVAPCSIVSEWTTVIYSAGANGVVQETDSNVIVSGKAVRPDLIARAAQRLAEVKGGTSLLIRFGRPTGITLTLDAVVRAFGRDKNGVWHPLRDAAGNYSLTLTSRTEDVRDGTLDWTHPVEVDCDGAQEVIVAVETTPTSGSSLNDSKLQVKLK